jgi:integrase
MGDLPVTTIDTTHVLKVLEPIWTQKTETAKRLRGRIENVVDWATARRFRTGENPARWRGHLDKLLARPSKVAKVQHHAALPYADVPPFFSELQQQAGIATLALQFCILTATRSGETLGAKWLEIDEAAAVWTVPGHRTKSGRDHRVPLSEAALAIIAQQHRIAEGEYVFPGAKRGMPLSNMAMAVLLRRMQRDDLTVHGFRSSFRDWAGECTNFPREVVEAALAHVLKDKTEAAYARGDLFEKRRRLMAAWARFCANTTMPARAVALKRA